MESLQPRKTEALTSFMMVFLKIRASNFVQEKMDFCTTRFFFFTLSLPLCAIPLNTWGMTTLS